MVDICRKRLILNAQSLISFGYHMIGLLKNIFLILKIVPIHCYDPTIKYSSIKKFSRKSIINLFKIKNLFNKNLLTQILNNIFLYNDYKKFFSKKVIHYESSIGIGEKK